MEMLAQLVIIAIRESANQDHLRLAKMITILVLMLFAIQRLESVTLLIIPILVMMEILVPRAKYVAKELVNEENQLFAKMITILALIMFAIQRLENVM